MSQGLSTTILASLLTVLANGVGALPFVFFHNVSKRWVQWGWAAAGGLMLSASIFNLIMPAVKDGGMAPAGIGIALGAMLMMLASKALQLHPVQLVGLTEDGSRRIVLVLATLFIHSFPEGLAIGVAYGSGEIRLGMVMALAIAIHNIPEGMAVALPLRAEGVSAWRCVVWALISGVPQFIAAVPAYLAVVAFRPVLPYAFGLAAGAMILLVFQEMIPESRAEEGERLLSAVASMLGFLGMMAFQLLL